MGLFQAFSAGAAGGADTECLCLGWYAAMYARAQVTVYGVRRAVPRDDRRGRGRGRVMVYAVCPFVRVASWLTAVDDVQRDA